MASTYLTRTPSSGGNRKTFTISAWFKKCKLGSNQILVQAATDGSTRSQITLRSDDAIEFYSENGGVTKINLKTNRLFRDINAWYHIVVAIDTTQGTNTNRAKLYINGVQETSLATATYPDQNYDTQFNHTVAHTIGRRDAYGDMYFEGIVSHFHLVDGSALAPTVFGSTDSTTGEWKINTGPSYTVGTNGFFVLKDTNSGTDQSANTNNLTVNGTLTKTEDCPSNVFCTLNTLVGFREGTGTQHENAPTYSNGNTKYTKSQATWSTQACTLGASSGKYYWEAKMENNGGDPRMYIGVVDAQYLNDARGHTTGNTTNGVGYNSHNGSSYVSGTTNNSYGNSFTSSHTVGCALDLDNHKIYFHKDGTWQNSGVPTSGSTGTGAISLTTGRTYLPSFTIHNSGCLANFGNGYFGTTAVSSAGTNASNLGIFEYDVPTGYTALCTKGLNE